MKITFNKQNPNGVRRSHIVVKHIVTRTFIHNLICKEIAASRVIMPSWLRSRQTTDEYIRLRLKMDGENSIDKCWQDDVEEDRVAKIESKANEIISRLYPELRDPQSVTKR